MASSGLGNVIYPHARFLLQPDLASILQDLHRRGIIVGSVWGYYPGAGDGSAAQGVAFPLPQATLDLAVAILGDSFGGLEMGEHDGGYLSVQTAASARGTTGGAHPLRPIRLQLAASERRVEFLRFWRYFDKVHAQLGYRMNLLDGAYFPHYLAKTGYYSMLGCETAEMLPNDQLFYSFTRGAGKQYGQLWRGYVSVWNHWAGKTCETPTSCSLTGASLALMRRLMVTEIMYGAAWFSFEAYWAVNQFLPEKNGTLLPAELTPIGRISLAGKALVEALPVLGAQLTPVAIVLDFFAGFAPPRNAYADYTQGHMYWNAGDVWRQWGPLPCGAGCFFAAEVFELLYPSWKDAQYYQDERGFLAATPFGDVADVLLSDAPGWLLEKYALVVFATRVDAMRLEVREKLELYTRNGGVACVTAETVESMGGIFGIQADGDSGLQRVSGGATVTFRTNILPTVVSVDEMAAFDVYNIDARRVVKNGQLEVAATVHTRDNREIPVLLKLQIGAGTLYIFATPGIGSRVHTQQDSKWSPLLNEMNKPLPCPRPMLLHVQAVLSLLLSDVALFSAGNDRQLSVVTTAVAERDDEYIVGVGNPQLTEVPLNISARNGLGDIVSIVEVHVGGDEVGKRTPGWHPTGFEQTDTGISSRTTIAGLDQRVFRVKVRNSKVAPVSDDLVAPPALPIKRALPLSQSTGSIQEAVLTRPSFFDHWDAVVVDWEYVLTTEAQQLVEEGRFACLQKLKIIVDFTSGLNLFPDLRLINNSKIQLKESLAKIQAVLAKMQLRANATSVATAAAVFSSDAIVSVMIASLSAYLLTAAV
eukprot:SAG31_NODE_1198_length_9441_cov_3.648897_10_plen_816_part_00